jgi:hypothetical protein
MYTAERKAIAAPLENFAVQRFSGLDLKAVANCPMLPVKKELN